MTSKYVDNQGYVQYKCPPSTHVGCDKCDSIWVHCLPNAIIIKTSSDRRGGNYLCLITSFIIHHACFTRYRIHMIISLLLFCPIVHIHIHSYPVFLCDLAFWCSMTSVGIMVESMSMP
jgi:hypothetical protein